MKFDTILCHDKADAKNALDAIGCRNVKDCEFFDDGRVRLILNCKIKDIRRENDKNRITKGI